MSNRKNKELIESVELAFKKNKELNEKINQDNAVFKSKISDIFEKYMDLYNISEDERFDYSMKNENCKDFTLPDLNVTINFFKYSKDLKYQKEIYTEISLKLKKLLIAKEQELNKANTKMKASLEGVLYGDTNIG